ncbi:MAG: GNAT family N-acetyltransferase [Betaproteobacteria bacterium]|nr:GNAT family N-acetyltransferase [Betaproteobacteria bacterium]
MSDLAALAVLTRRLEELTLNTSPAIHQALYDGWLLRASATDTRRANSATAMQPSTLPLEEKINRTEEWYRTYGQPAMFRLTEALAPPELDGLLAKRGYSREVETWVMTKDLSRGIPPGDYHLPESAKLLERSEDEGLDDIHRMKAVSAALHTQDLKRQALWKGPQVFLSLKTSHGIASTGMARLEAGHLGIFNMRTASKARDKGYATILVAYLLAWGLEQGASTAFLQVDQANEAAIAVYRKFGFSPAYTYWHRVQPAVPATGTS